MLPYNPRYRIDNGHYKGKLINNCNEQGINTYTFTANLDIQ